LAIFTPNPERMKNFILALAALIVISFSPEVMLSAGANPDNPGIQHPKPPPKPKAPKKAPKPKKPKPAKKSKPPPKPPRPPF
jgi:hypothetical protein